MKIIQLKNNGQLTEEDESYFGGKYSFIDRIKMGGIGSTKVIYQSGIPHFDELNQYVENEVPYVNFEIMKNGFLIRLNRNQVTRYVGLQLQEFKGVHFATIVANKKYKLEINTLHDDVFHFTVSFANLKSIKSYFGKRVFQQF